MFGKTETQKGNQNKNTNKTQQMYNAFLVLQTCVFGVIDLCGLLERSCENIESFFPWFTVCINKFILLVVASEKRKREWKSKGKTET